MTTATVQGFVLRQRSFGDDDAEHLAVRPVTMWFAAPSPQDLRLTYTRDQDRGDMDIRLREDAASDFMDFSDPSEGFGNPGYQLSDADRIEIQTFTLNNGQEGTYLVASFDAGEDLENIDDLVAIPLSGDPVFDGVSTLADLTAVADQIRETTYGGDNRGEIDLGALLGAHVSEDDIYWGRAGNDTYAGGGGNDSLDGREGADTLLGQRGNDRLFGSEGRDTLSGGTGQDRLSGGTGNDRLEGGDGRDVLLGGKGNDDLSGGAGSDRLDGGGGHDMLAGGGKADVLIGGSGNDVLNGGGGADAFHFTQGSGQDTIRRFEADRDTLVFDRDLRGTVNVTREDGETRISYGSEGDSLLILNEELRFRDIDLDFV